MRFLDQTKIFVESGSGGRGCVAFLREKFRPNGGPSGGNGGRGGDIILHCVDALNTLIDFRYRQHFRASAGGAGEGKMRFGRNAEHVIIPVPLGTEVWSDDNAVRLFDLNTPDQRVMLAPGGEGGRGNASFRSSRHQAPRETSPPGEGIGFYIWLRLKLMGDSGLIGLPNAGKSSLLTRISKAHPAIGDYPFTTLAPQKGSVISTKHPYFVIDLPGLIEGAHQGRGLGMRFLGHVERCRCLLHCVEISEDIEDIYQRYQCIRHEISCYGHNLSEKSEVIVLTKCDKVSASISSQMAQLLTARLASPVITVSCDDWHELTELLNARAAPPPVSPISFSERLVKGLRSTKP